MDLIPLPNELIDKVIGFCSQKIQFSLLKSKAFATSAYKHYYKRVKLAKPLYDFTYQYNDTETIYQEGPVMYPSREFSCAKSLLLFYKTHPLYNPDTLLISDFKQLESLHELKPNFLKKFKNIEYEPTEIITIPPKLMDLNFSIIKTTETLQFPKTITKLKLVNCSFGAPPYIQELKLDNVKIDFDDLKQIPNLRKLTLESYRQDVVINHPTLFNLTLQNHAGKADMSGCKKLADFTLLFEEEEWFDYTGPEEYTLGFDMNDTYRLPPTLSFLLLKNVLYSPTLAKLSQFQNLQFLQIYLDCGSEGLSIINVPSNLMGLVIESENYDFDVSCNVPPKLTYLDLQLVTGFDLQLPESLIYLDLQGFYSCLHDYLHLKNLSTLYPAMCVGEQKGICFKKLKLPLHIEDLLWRDDGNLGKKSPKKLRNLKNITSERVSKIVLPDLVRQLQAFDREPVKVSGGSNLQRLDITVLESFEMLKFNFKNLTSITIKGEDNYWVHSYFEVPETLQYLSLRRVYMGKYLKIPRHLKYLSLNQCRLVSTPVLNDK